MISDWTRISIIFIGCQFVHIHCLEPSKIKLLDMLNMIIDKCIKYQQELNYYINFYELSCFSRFYGSEHAFRISHPYYLMNTVMVLIVSMNYQNLFNRIL